MVSADVEATERMDRGDRGAREVLVVGLNHRTAPVAVREGLALTDERIDEMNRLLCSLGGVDEAAVVSTCNRVEIIACASDGERMENEILSVLRDMQPGIAGDLDNLLYTHRDREAVRHVFRVASSLDSMVVGEPQILGQLKDFYARAASVGATGTVLHRCFHKAFSVAKRVRTETAIAARAVSVGSAAVELASRIFEDFADKTAMLIGAGEMGELAARQLVAAGVGGLMVTNRTFDRAVEMAREFGGTPVPFDGFPRYLPMADIIIGATAATGFVLTRDAVQTALRERKGKPMFCIDVSVPRNFDPQINDIDNAYLYDVDDLSEVAEVNLEERAREAGKAEQIVLAEVESFWRWFSQLDVVPTIVSVRAKLERIRQAELARVLQELGPLTDAQRQALERMTTSMVNKILHTPITRLKTHDRRDELFFVDAVRSLFELDEPEDP